MRALIIVALLFVMGCATTANYEARVQSWKGRDADALVKVWGQPDVTEKLENGNRMFVYVRLKREPLAYNGAQRQLASMDNSKTVASSNLYIKCSTYFEVTSQNIIASVIFRGEECKSRD